VLLLTAFQSRSNIIADSDSIKRANGGETIDMKLEDHLRAGDLKTAAPETALQENWESGGAARGGDGCGGGGSGRRL